MKYAVHLTVLSIMLLFFSCGKSDKCSNENIPGQSNANSSYKNYSANAQFSFSDQEEMEFSLDFELYEDDCFFRSAIYSNNIFVGIGDTIKLEVSQYLGEVNTPTSFYFIFDGDATPVEEYKLIESENNSNWILIESINTDNTELSGRFNMSFVTKNEKILSGERERSDDPNRPDTLHFFDGEFMAVRNN